jgi:hypothetical protein
MARKLSVNDLSTAGGIALADAQARIAGPESAMWKEYEALVKRAVVEGHTPRDLAKLVATGVRELMDLGVVECEQDGEGNWVPKLLHEELIEPAVTPIIMTDLR